MNRHLILIVVDNLLIFIASMFMFRLVLYGYLPLSYLSIKLKEFPPRPNTVLISMNSNVWVGPRYLEVGPTSAKSAHF